MSITGTSNAMGGYADTHPQKICCKGNPFINKELGFGPDFEHCAPTLGLPVILLSDISNAHVEPYKDQNNHFFTDFNKKICMTPKTDCAYYPGVCPSGKKCITGLTSMTNAHIMPCGGQINICCNAAPSPCAFTSAVMVTNNCTAGICNKGDRMTFTASISRDCSGETVMQVDYATDDFSRSCMIGDMDRDYGNTPQSQQPGEYRFPEIRFVCSNGICSGTWTIPAIPQPCQGKTMDGTIASLWSATNVLWSEWTVSRDSQSRFRFATPPSQTCGNGAHETGEECDTTAPNPLNGKDCRTLSYDSGTLSCFPPGHAHACQFNTTGCTHDQTSSCGNNILDLQEECDPLLPVPTCEELDYDEGTVTCNTNNSTQPCELNTTACTYIEGCNNGIIEGDEECDGTHFGGLTCTDYDYIGGQLTCTDECNIDTRTCTDCLSDCEKSGGSSYVFTKGGSPLFVKGGSPLLFKINQTSTCTDSDGGQKTYTFGWVYGRYANSTNYNLTDACGNASRQINERVCTGNLPSVTTKNCNTSDTCRGGACVHNQTNTTGPGNNNTGTPGGGGSPSEICNDRIENEGRIGCIDRNDAACGGFETSCTNGIDDDCDGNVDCADLDCTQSCKTNPPPIEDPKSSGLPIWLIITMSAIPLLGGGAFFLYKKISVPPPPQTRMSEIPSYIRSMQDKGIPLEKAEKNLTAQGWAPDVLRQMRPTLRTVPTRKRASQQDVHRRIEEAFGKK